jgi:phosphoribosyl 1,2-cyclic phosphate phosphodiesterase
MGLPEGVLLIDTPPDLRTQLLRERIGLVHAVAFTHEHADHVFGLDDLRLFQFYLGHAIPLYCESSVENRIRKAYDYAFEPIESTHAGAVPKLEFHTIGTEPFQLLGATIHPVRLRHGPRFDVLGFRIGNIAYCTDTSAIPDESWPVLEGVEILILDALRYKPHPTHMCLDEAIDAARRIGAQRSYFTHLSHDFDHDTTNQSLPDKMELAYDGLRIELNLGDG